MLIGLSGKKRSGKSSATEYLVNKYDFKPVSWAAPLKQIIGRQLLGLTDAEMETDIKENINQFWGKSPRNLLQDIGTNCFRDRIHPDFWVKVCERDTLKPLLAQGENIVISDCRFPNEAECIRANGGTMVRITRIGYNPEKVDMHPSETALDRWDFDYQIGAADGDLQELYEKLDRLMANIPRGERW